MENTWNNLVERARNNDQNAFYELYQNSYDAVYLAVKSMIKDDDTVLDIVQDAFIKGFDSLSTLDNPERFLPWLKRIATNKARDWYKRKHDVSFSQLSDDEDYIPDFEDDRLEHLPEEVIDRNETRRLIDEILGTLSDEQRIAIGMFYYQDMSIAEIASEIGVSENTVKSRLNYGRKKIRTGVEELEKKGTKLYGLAPVPFLIWLFKCQTAQASTGTAPAAIFENIVSQSASLSAATSTGAASAGAAASAGGGLFSSVSAKIIAGVLSAVLIIGIGTGVFLAATREGDADIPVAVEEVTPELTEEATTEVAETTTQPTTVTTTETTTQPTTVTTTQATTETTTKKATTEAPKDETGLIVLPGEYEEFYAYAFSENAKYKIIPAKKGGKWGVINDKGEKVIAFEYDEIQTVTASGHVLAKKTEGDKTVSYIFDANGQKLLSSEKIVYCGDDIALIAEFITNSEELSIYSLEIRRLSTGETLAKYDRAGHLGISWLEDFFGVAVLNENSDEGTFLLMNKNGKILNEMSYGHRSDNYIGGAYGGYYRHGNRSSDGGTYSNISGTENYQISYRDLSIWDFGGTFLALTNNSESNGEMGKVYLFDVSKVSGDKSYYWIEFKDRITQKGYDSISIGLTETYFLVQDGAKWGYISRSGAEKAMYDGAGRFVNGRSIILDGGTAYVIDDTFTRLSDGLSGYTSVSTVGDNLFGVEKNGKWYLAVYRE